MTDLTKLKLGVAILTILLAAGCNTVTPPEQYNPGSFVADFSDIDGVPSYFTATNAKASQGVSDFAVTASTSNSLGTYVIYISNLPVGSVLPYTAASTQTGSTLTVQYHDATNNEDYEGSFNSGSCWVTITQTSPTLQGSFGGKLVSTTRITDSVRNVTSGSFNAIIQ
jgi:hypothetical protein